MRRTAISLLLAALLVVQLLDAQQPAANNAAQQTIAELPANAHVALHLTDGNTIRGRIASTGQNNFVLKPDKGGARQTITYTQVVSVEQIRGHSTRKWIVIGVVAAVVTVGIIAGVVFANRKY